VVGVSATDQLSSVVVKERPAGQGSVVLAEGEDPSHVACEHLKMADRDDPAD
jgi:hypothetical protein